MSTAPRHPHPRPTGGPWLRILVVLVVAMLATGPHPEAFTASAAPAVTGTTEGAAEHDVLDRPCARHPAKDTAHSPHSVPPRESHRSGPTRNQHRRRPYPPPRP